MKLFQRQRTTKLDNKMLPPPAENKEQLTPEPTVKTVPTCAYCNQPANPEHIFVNGDLYLRRLAYNYLCNEHWEQRQLVINRHPVAIRKTQVETPAVRPQEGA